MVKLAFTLLLTVLCTFSPVSLANEGGGGGGGEGGPEYLALESVLVNLDGKRHYLRADIQLLVENKERSDKIKNHMPAIRHAMIMLFSGRDPDEMASIAERERYRQEAMAEITKVLEKVHADEGLEDLFFTDFLVQ